MEIYSPCTPRAQPAIAHSAVKREKKNASIRPIVWCTGARAIAVKEATRSSGRRLPICMPIRTQIHSRCGARMWMLKIECVVASFAPTEQIKFKCDCCRLHGRTVPRISQRFVAYQLWESVSIAPLCNNSGLQMSFFGFSHYIKRAFMVWLM